MKDKWNVQELHSMLVQEEIILKNQGNHSINYVNNQGAGKKVGKKHDRKGKRLLKINGASSSQIHKKELQ
ncbi:Retrovirus-related Pol polyprotein from transposon TNT 1-94 [Sesbania bispinosa]|nr:Retrovirus-related Pol polyprotein from transposon TNT 1-94 [Sesbania bispinosa]